MVAPRFSRLAALLAVAPVLAACTTEPAPLAPVTVELAVVSGADHGGRPFATDLTQEVTHTPVWFGDPDGSGKAKITVNFGQKEVCWNVSVADITVPASASHIHEAAPGIRGGIVVGLVPPDGSGTSTGCTHVADEALLKRIIQAPEGFYVNVHNSDYPAGAVRGQLAK